MTTTNRFADIDPFDAQPGHNDYIYCELVSLERAIQPLIYIVDKIVIHATTAKRASESISYEDQLTHDEAAAIYLYSMETGLHSVYRTLNATLRTNNFRRLKPWFLYLKLFHTALNKLPSEQVKVWRGTPKDVSADYLKERRLTWKSVSFCSKDLSIVNKDKKEHGTLFSIDCKNGKSISKYSASPKEHEIILMPGVLLKVKNDPFEYHGLRLVDLEELPNLNIRRKYSVLPRIKKDESLNFSPVPRDTKKYTPDGTLNSSRVLPAIKRSSISTAPSSQQRTKKFIPLKTFSCPHCAKSNYWKNVDDYAQGLKVTCHHCERTFQYINCPHCNGPNKWTKNNYEQGSRIVCSSCKESFQYINCPHCKNPKFFSNCDYQPGSLIICHSCESSFQHLPCPHCSTSNIWSTADYHAGQKKTCFQCRKQFQHTTCPHCQTANFFPKADYQLGTLVTCSACKGKFSHVNCPNCSGDQYYKARFQYGINYSCSECQCTFQQVACFHCHTPNVWCGDRKYKQGQMITCVSCDKAFQHLWCPHCYGANYFSSCNYNEGEKIRCAECHNGFQHRQCNSCDAANFWKTADYDRTLSVRCCDCEEKIPAVELEEKSEVNSVQDESEAENQSITSNQS